jgi:hypothetical protein
MGIRSELRALARVRASRASDPVPTRPYPIRIPVFGRLANSID